MDKVTLCFGINGALAEEFQAIAKAQNVDLESLLSRIVGQYIENYRSEPQEGSGAEKRKFGRKSVEIPAVIQIQFSDNELQCKSAKIFNISLGGLMLRLNDTNAQLAGMLMKAEKFEIVFTLPDGSSTVTFLCKPIRVISDRQVEVGAYFISNEKECYEAVYNYLM